jgi:hypothetical protein
LFRQRSLHHGLDHALLIQVCAHEVYHVFQKATGRPTDEEPTYDYGEGFMKQIGLFTKPLREPLSNHPASGLYTKPFQPDGPRKKVTVFKVVRQGAEDTG